MAYAPYHIREGQWEYKTVRAPNGEFGHAEHLRAVIRQERRAGWTVVEKMNDWQVRFRRPQDAYLWDDQLPPGVDPYRTVYTFSDQANWLHALVMAAGIMFVIFAMVILVMVVSWP
jgi:hypothetical protein